MRTIIFQRRRVIGRLIVSGRFFFNKPAANGFSRAKSLGNRRIARFHDTQNSPSIRMLGLKTFANQPVASLPKLRKRTPKMIARTPIMTAYQAIIQINAAAPASGFHKRRPAKMIEAKPIKMRNHSPLISRRILIANAISVAPIIMAQAAM